MQPAYHKVSDYQSKKHQAPAIPGGVYMISPLAAVSAWAALKLKRITWFHLCVWIALYEVRTWRDTQTPAQRNLFRFNPRRVAQALGNRNAGPHLKKGLAELEQLGLACLTSTDISFTSSFDDLPADLRAETDRMLKSLGNDNITRAIRMPRRVMRGIMQSNVRPLRVAVLFGMLLRIMPGKRYGWYKGCLTAALLVNVSGFNESRIKHERAALIREGYFERLETPVRVRNQHGDWYALAHDLPVPSGLKTRTNQQSPPTPKCGNRHPLSKKPAPSSGIETNQFLPAKPSASRSTSMPKAMAAPSWHRMLPQDFREPQRRTALYEDACHKGVIGDSAAERLMFFAAMARARRLGSINPCGMFRRIVETSGYHGHISGCDEEQARVWLVEDRPQDLDTTNAHNLLWRILETQTNDHHPSQAGDSDAGASIDPETRPANHVADFIAASYFAHKLRRAGFPTHDAFNLIMTTHEGKQYLTGWTQDRWNRAAGTLRNCHINKLPSPPLALRQKIEFGIFARRDSDRT